MTKIFICGDIVNYGNDDGLICSSSLSKKISEADYSICNFEAPIEINSKPVPKSGPHHYQEKTTISGLDRQGFNLLCLANNHIMDYGESGLTATIKEAKQMGLETIGAGFNFNQAYEPVVKRFNNIKIGFINACEAQFGVIDYFSSENQPGYAWINHSEIDKRILELKKECDFVIVLAHAGLEHYDIPQKEWRLRFKHFCDLGADAVVGSHPHVPQGYEYYNDSIIFYSLGNFYFDSKKFRMKEDSSYSIILELGKNKKVDFEPIFHYKKNGVVQLAPIEKQIDLKVLNNILFEDYNRSHDNMSLEIFYGKIKKNLIYSLSPIPYDGGLKSSVKRIINFLLGRNKVNKRLLSLHLLRNESYYYATKHALELISRNKDLP
ncbi:hypothetical protein CIL05_00045 [Virgibacillus profundi]|uniref:Capsule synthesis protein CapA domain-containing protein n=1 Tax=Virgibacillus profundi TaxID=2024555 RepID=A0A2A2IHI4_9BACI|nr:CapA family protein [Virgibacillus profundi]PAV31087.1 hypothetical protein CIL05_00045 [Virgibacillus profundi]PXY55270.1 CapA family protein [Virgibacillus profundi]